MKKSRGKSSATNGKVYMNLALSNQSKELYGNRPYGGRKGITNHYPPSKAAITSERPTDFLNDVKNMVFRQEEEERSGSPSWIGKYNKEINHTGEQPLMVQRFLSNNKQEQQDGVLPASSRPPSRFHVEREDDTEYYHGLSLHQYLTATEMPGQSEKLVDVRHGRPTRTSLLRARQRTKNIPGPEKTKFELRDDIHYLQEQTLRREEKYKSVDVPDELQPLRDEGESVHQFLVGARYNRTYYRDAKCFNKVGLYVSRENPQHCFLKNGVTQEALLANKSEKANNMSQGAFSEVTASELNSLCQSTSSFQGSQKLLQPPASARQAWGTSSIASAPSPTPNDSRESFAISTKDDQEFAQEVRSRNDADGKPKSNARPTKRVTLKSAPAQHSSSSVTRSTTSSCDSCILCQEGSAVKHGIPVHFHGRNIMSAPNRRKWTHHAQRSRNVNRETNLSLPRKGQNADLMLVQQYHLRILGTQSHMNKKEDRCHSPESKIHYSPGRTPSVSRPKTAASSIRQNPNRNRNNSNAVEDAGEEGTIRKKTVDSASTASKISVHISTGEEADADEVSPRVGAVDPEATPRSQDVTVGSTMDGGGSLADLATPRTLDLTDGAAGIAGEAEVPQSDHMEDSAIQEPSMSNEVAADSKNYDILQEVDASQDADAEISLENGEDSRESQVNDGAVANLAADMAQVNLHTSLAAADEAVSGETVEEQETEQSDGHEDPAIAQRDSPERSVTFAEPDR